MGRDKKTAKGRLDRYYHLAKEQGYRSRAAFKLIQLNKKFNFLAESRCVLDLCAAPGGWLQVAAKYCPVSSVIVGVDLVPIKPIHNVLTFTEDITTDKCRQTVQRALKGWQVDCVLHDGAPNVGTAWLQDAYSQVELTLKALKLATEFLKGGGWFVTKVFRSKDYFALMWVLGQLFHKVHATKPQASRNVSAEIFVVCQGYKAPAKLDSRMLDPKFIFKDVDVPQTVTLDTLATKKKAPAHGYETGNYGQYRKRAAKEFVMCDDGITFLAGCNEISLDGAENRCYAEHKSTTNEIKACMADLKLLGKKELRGLLNWRKAMREEFSSQLDESVAKVETEEVPPSDEKKETNERKRQRDSGEDGKAKEIKREKTMEKEDEGEGEGEGEELSAGEQEVLAIEEQVIAAEEAVKRDDKRKKRKEYRKKVKEQQRIALKMDQSEEGMDLPLDQSLFSLSTIKTGAALAKVSAQDVSSAEGSGEDEPLDGEEELEYDDMTGLEDEDDAYRARREQELEEMFALHKSRKQPGVVAEAKLKTRRKDGAAYEMGIDNDDQGDEGIDPNPLVVDVAESSVSDKAAMWFSQDVFKGIADEPNDDMALLDSLPAGHEANIAAVDQEMAGHDWKNGQTANARASPSGDSFEVVANETSESDDDTDSGDEMASSQREPLDADGLALGTMLLKKKSRFDLIDGAYNRNAFGNEDLPSWFVDYNQRFNTRPPPVSNDLVQFYKDRMKELDSRPIKKIAEAKARKRMKTMRKLEEAKKKAEAILKSDSAEGTKAKQIERVLSKAKSKRKTKTTLVVARKSTGQGRPAGVKGRYKRVDKRMLKDKRAMQNAQKKSKGKKRR